MTACPFCAETGGFHNEEVHAAIPIPPDKLLPVLAESVKCRACGLPILGPGAEGCLYPKHGEDLS